MLLRRLRCQEDLRLTIFGPPSAGTIGGSWEEGGPSQTPLPLQKTPPPPSSSTSLPPLRARGPAPLWQSRGPLSLNGLSVRQQARSCPVRSGRCSGCVLLCGSVRRKPPEIVLDRLIPRLLGAPAAARAAHGRAGAGSKHPRRSGAVKRPDPPTPPPWLRGPDEWVLVRHTSAVVRPADPFKRVRPVPFRDSLCERGTHSVGAFGDC